MHERCVLDDTLSRTYQRLAADTETNETLKSNKKGRKKSPKTNHKGNVWDGKFTAKIIPRRQDEEQDPGAGESAGESLDGKTDIKSAGKIQITDLRDRDGEDDKPTTWEEDIQCLGCRRAIA